MLEEGIRKWIVGTIFECTFIHSWSVQGWGQTVFTCSVQCVCYPFNIHEHLLQLVINIKYMFIFYPQRTAIIRPPYLSELSMSPYKAARLLHHSILTILIPCLLVPFPLMCCIYLVCAGKQKFVQVKFRTDRVKIQITKFCWTYQAWVVRQVLTPSLHLVSFVHHLLKYALCLLVVCRGGLWKAVGWVVVGV